MVRDVIVVVRTADDREGIWSTYRIMDFVGYLSARHSAFFLTGDMVWGAHVAG